MRLLPRIFGRARASVPDRVLALGAGATLAQIETVEAQLLRQPQVHAPVIHRFAPGVYMRTVIIPAGCNALGHEHLTDHFNVILRGRVLVLCGGRVEEIRAPAVFVASAGVRKVVHTLEETEWANIHPTTETDLTKIEAAFVRHSPTFELHAAEAAALAEARAALEGGV